MDSRPTQTGDTPLHIACELGFESVASLLLAKGASAIGLNRTMYTSRQLALYGGFTGIVKMIDLRPGQDTWL